MTLAQMHAACQRFGVGLLDEIITDKNNTHPTYLAGPSEAA